MKSFSESIANLKAAVTDVENAFRNQVPQPPAPPVDPSADALLLQAEMDEATVRLRSLVPPPPQLNVS